MMKGSEPMTREQLTTILNALKGLSYLDWNRLSMVIESYYQKEAHRQNNRILLEDLDYVVDGYCGYSSES